MLREPKANAGTETLEFREVFLLREFEEFSYQEIASLLDRPPGTVMSRLARARSKLRVLLSSTSAEREQTGIDC